MSAAEKMENKTDESPSRTLPAWVRTNFRAFEEGINGHKASPIHKIRKKALEKFEETGLPLPKDEEWKYTNISDLNSKNFKLALSSPTLSLNELTSYLVGGTDAPRIVFTDGRYSKELSNIESETGRINGVKISTFSEAVQNSEAFAAYYSSIKLREEAFETEQPIIALNTSFAGEGLAITVSADTVADKFLHLVFVTNAKEEVFSAPRLLINSEKGSSLTILESHIGLGSVEYLATPVSEINIAQNAELNYLKLNLESEKAYHLGNISLNQERDSRSRILLFSTGGKLVRNEVRLKLNGSNAHAVLNGLTVLDNEQHVDNHTVIDHALPNSESRESIKGIYAGKAKGVFNGTIIVREDAQKTNAYQSNQTVLLSKDATIDTKPQLKIWADDVKCTHGATVGQLDPEAMFYLRSRGIDQNTARDLLVHAFASEVISDIKDASIKEYLESRLSEKLASIDTK